MKEKILVGLTIVAIQGLHAQSQQAIPTMGNLIPYSLNAVYPSDGELVPGTSSGAHKGIIKKNTGPVKTMGVSYVDIGLAPNVFTAVGTPKTQVWADPNLKTINFIHRSCNKLYTQDLNTGAYRHDYSTDGGIYWEVDYGAFYTHANNVGRYPQAVVYNPGNGTDISQAKLAYRGCYLNATSSSFEGIIWGTVGSLDGTTSTGGANTSPYTTNPGFISDGLTITKGGTIWAVDKCLDPASGTKYTYKNEIAIYKGVYNNSTKVFDYTLKKINGGYSKDDKGEYVNGGSFKVAFGDDGNTGYIVSIGHTDYVQVPDSVSYLVVYKTTDGGNSWSLPMGINMNSDQVNKAWQIAATKQNDVDDVSPWFSFDAVVDKNNELHIISNVMAAGSGFQLSLEDQTYGIGHIYSQGSMWKGELIHRPQSMFNWFAYDNSNVSCTADVRGQASINWAGDKIIFSWFESDTNKFPHIHRDTYHTNAFPNMFIRGVDLNTGKWTAVKKVTDADPNQGISAINFAVASHYTLDSADFHMVPVTFANLYGDTGATGMAGGDPAAPPGQVQFSYIFGAGFTDSEFNATVTSYNFSQVTSVNNMAAAENKINVSACYPNPFNKTSVIQVYVNKPADAVVEIHNTLGELVSFTKHNGLAPGNNDITLDGSTLTAGVYFYTVKVDDHKVTQKMIIK